MKKILKSKLFFFILGIAVAGSISTALAYSFFAPDVGFTPREDAWEVDNVGDAIDDLHEIVKISNYTGNLYLCGDTRANTSRYSYFDIDVSKYKNLTLNITTVYGDSSVFTFYVQADGVTVLNIKSRGTYNIDVTDKSKVRIYYYENSGYYYAVGTYTLTR